MCAAGDPLTAETIAGLPASVRIIATFSVGYEHVDVAAADQARHPGLQHARRALQTPRPTSPCSACWAPPGAPTKATTMLTDPQLGRLDAHPAHGPPCHRQTTRYPGHGPHRPGGGRAGARLPHADPLLQPLRACRPTSRRARIFHANPDDMLPHCDFLSINAPMTPATRKWVNAERIAKLPKGAIVVNTARGGVVDDEALIAALNSGRLPPPASTCSTASPRSTRAITALRTPSCCRTWARPRSNTQRHGLQGARQSRSLPAQGAGAAGRGEAFLTAAA